MDEKLMSIYQSIAELGRKYHAEKIVLFGSRARGDQRERSDIDLAVFGMPSDALAGFLAAVDELPTLLKFDITPIVPDMDENFLKNIEHDGVVLYEKD